MDLLECRKELDGIDRQIVELFEKRMEICGHVAESKLASGKAVYDGERERQKLEAVEAMAHGDFNRTAVTELFSQMMTISRRYQYKLLEEGGKSEDLGFRRVEGLPAKGAKLYIRAWRALTAMALPFSILEKKQMCTMWSILETLWRRFRQDGQILQSFPLRIPLRGQLWICMTF